MKIILTLIFMLLGSTSFGQKDQLNSANTIQDNWNAADPYEYFIWADGAA